METPMNDNLQRMRAGEWFDTTDPALFDSLNRARRLCAALRPMGTDHPDYRTTIEQLIPGFPTDSILCPPFDCDHGHGITVGHGVFINYGCTMLDGGPITIGNHVLIGPNCQLYTPLHPMDHIERRSGLEREVAISIGDDTWLGGGVVVCPGVSIGKRCVIGAGSVVVKDIPDDSLAVGNPCRVVRSLKK